jgi:hypothetical protein
MKVLDESGKGIEAGATLPIEELGLPVSGRGPTLIVFWKRL